MTVNRSIFIFIKRPQILFAGGLMTGLALTIGYTIATSPLKQTCFAPPASFYTIKDENNVTLARGIYRSYRDGLHEDTRPISVTSASFSGRKTRRASFTRTAQRELYHVPSPGNLACI